MSLAPKRKIWLPREKWECLRRRATATDHGHPRDRTQNNRPDLADVPRPTSSRQPSPRRRKTRISGRFSSEIPVTRSLSSDHYFRRVRYGFSSILRVLADGSIGLDRF
ncbi:hypothetical protein L3X38_018117 [Prunus dulcis]|uniref:Uncharacterized protein n=1 Tax=Prunus dulcis TaxID=3755 RepID=A0AAD4ZAG2_PRUDU|nr:hypothetical protein L3X38_018117 [Prunus dulcis]